MHLDQQWKMWSELSDDAAVGMKRSRILVVKKRAPCGQDLSFFGRKYGCFGICVSNKPCGPRVWESYLGVEGGAMVTLSRAADG